MVLTYRQIPHDYEQVLRLLHVDDIGTPFRNLHFLQSLGLKTQIRSTTPTSLQSFLELGLPIIAAVDTGELTSYWAEQTRHAVVVVGIEGDLVYINDPGFASAPQVVPRAEFELAWLNVDYLCAVIGLPD